MDNQWERVVADDEGWDLYRVVVPGGWLYRAAKGGPMVFVPDPSLATTQTEYYARMNNMPLP